MSYLLIRVHSWECDYPGCTAEEEHAEPFKADAWKILAKDGWRVLGSEIACPRHAAALLSKRQGTS